jgi:hypothetical protein
MHHDNWARIEALLDKYQIRPIVGIIPESKDSKFCWPVADDFWTVTAKRYVEKGWIIAQHGCHHLYMPHIKSEFAGLSYDKQDALIQKGYGIMQNHGIIPTCFFSPAYNFDDTTIAVCRAVGHYDYLSDGYAVFPHTYNEMLFLPVLPNKLNLILPIGILTFVYHPNVMTDRMFYDFESLLKTRKKCFHDVEAILERFTKKTKVRKRGILDCAIEKICIKRQKQKKKPERFVFGKSG